MSYLSYIHERFSDQYFKVLWEGVKLNSFSHMGIRNKSFERSRIFRYGLPEQILSAKKTKQGAVMWIRIDRMQITIHKIWSMWIRIQNNKITKFIMNHLLKVKKKKKIISKLYLNLIGWLNSAFPSMLYTWIQMNADPTGSGSTSLTRRGVHCTAATPPMQG